NSDKTRIFQKCGGAAIVDQICRDEQLGVEITDWQRTRASIAEAALLQRQVKGRARSRLASGEDSKCAANKLFRIGDVAGERNGSDGFRQLNELTCAEVGRFAKRERTLNGRNGGQISERLFHVTHPAIANSL